MDNLHKILFTFIAIIFMMPAFTQENETAVKSSDTRFDGVSIYRSEVNGGLIIHTNGWGFSFRKGKHTTVNKRFYYGIEAVGMKHFKEHKSYNPTYDDTKGFVFGKLNTLTILRPQIGKQKIWYFKETKRGVQIGYVAFAGLSLGLAKPVYLYVVNPNSFRTPLTEKYDAEKHTIDKILGRAPVMKGVNETKIYPGLHTKFGLNFEYSPQDELLRSVEVGVAADAFNKEIPIMAFAPNRQLYFTFYASWHFGKKTY
jgi:hypothetical protein